MSHSPGLAAPLILVLSVPCFAACSAEEGSPAPSTGGATAQGGSGGSPTGGSTGGNATTGGTLNTGGTVTAGKSGAGGSTGGNAAGGNAGSSTGGSAGNGGTIAGTGGAAGGGGATAGSAGNAGGAGNAGNAGGAGKSSGGAGGTAGSAGAGGGGAGGSGGSGKFTLTSPAFENRDGCAKATPMPCDVFPDENLSYMQNMNISPEMSWSGAPAGTQSFAILLQDVTINAAHWVIWNIPASVSMVAANIPKDTAMPAVPAGSQQASATFAQGDGYFGPGSSCNVYEFVLYALSVATFTPNNATDAGQIRTQLMGLGEQVIATTNLRGRSNYMMMCSN
jgi:phosphatidylethanolamine-binding protein (PEBP) family uncharacterized protein